MIPDPAEILRRRVTAATTIRIITIVPVLASVLVVGVWFAQASTNRVDVDEHVAFAVMAVLFCVAAVVMWSLAPFSARQAVRMPRHIECPGCRYRLEGLTEQRCPECGLLLTGEFLADPGEHTPPPRDPDRFLLRQIATMVVRLSMAIAMLINLPIALFGTVETIQWATDPWEWAPVLVAYFMLLVCFTTLLLAGKLSGFIVPRRSKFGPPASGDRVGGGAGDGVGDGA